MSTGTTIAFGFIGLVAIYGIVALSLAIKRVPPGHARNVRRLPLTYARWDTEGEKRRTLGPGWHLVIPGRDQVGSPIDLREQDMSLTGRRVLTADNVYVAVDTMLLFQVTDPLAAFTVGNQNEAVERLVPMLLSELVGSLDLQQTMATSDEISTGLRQQLNDVSGTLGVRTSSVEVRSISPVPDRGRAGATRQHSAGPSTAADAVNELVLQRAGEAIRRLDQPGHSSKLLGLMSQFCFKVAIPGLGILALSFAIPSIGPSWAAHLGHGSPGIFTATAASPSADCSGACHSYIWHGTFTARDGTVVTNVRLADGGRITGLGEQEAVRYEGGQVVYPSGGGPDWLLYTIMLIAGTAAVAFWIFLLIRPLARRRRQFRRALDTSVSTPISRTLP
jgi:SPFH domain / Band 7 family